MSRIRGSRRAQALARRHRLGLRDAHNRTGLDLVKAGRFAEAVEAFRAAFRCDPNDHRSLANAAVPLIALDRLDEAEACCVGAIAMVPDCFEAIDNLGVVCMIRGDYARAIDCHREALRIRPDLSRIRRNLAAAYEHNGDFEQAVVLFDEVLQEHPDDRESHIGRGLSRLVLGDLGGMDDLDYRLDRTRNHAQEIEGIPRWDGRPLDGTLLVNQYVDGFGDCIQGIRSAAIARSRVGSTILLCSPAIARLMARADGIDRVVTDQSELSEITAQVATLSLPWRVQDLPCGKVPARVPYLSVESEDVARWTALLDDIPGYRIGLVWQGDPNNSNDARRSFQLHYAAALAAVPGVTLVSLQKGCGAEQVAEAGIPIVDLMERPVYRDGDFYDTAAAMQCLDLIVAADTGLAHLAGALGRPLWIVLPFAAEWRWQRHRLDSPWYPTARLWRQSEPGDWPGVFVRMADAIAAR